MSDLTKRLRVMGMEADLLLHEAADALDDAERRIAAALALHIQQESSYCTNDGDDWPCPTVRALSTGSDT